MSYNISQATPLFIKRAADLQSIADQTMTKIGSFTTYIPTKIVGVRISGGVTVACLGGIYTGATKSGTAIVAAAQSWVAVTGALGFTDATIASLGTALTATPIFSLSTGSTAACAADILIYGVILD